MSKKERTISLTYDELLEEIKATLRALSRTSSASPDAFDRGSRSGAINFWYQLALKTSATEKQCHDDINQLRILAGLKSIGQEPPADGS